MRVLWAYLERHGRPQAVYTDRAGIFQPALPPGWKSEELSLCARPEGRAEGERGATAVRAAARNEPLDGQLPSAERPDTEGRPGWGRDGFSAQPGPSATGSFPVR